MSVKTEADRLAFHPGYFQPTATVYEQYCRVDLANVDFDTMVGTGLSGALIVPRLADALDVNWLIIRKPNDSTHASDEAVGWLGKRWLFVDDFMESGATFHRVHKTVKTLADRSRTEYVGDKYRKMPPWSTEFVGAYLYGRSQVLSPADILGRRR